MDSFFGTTSPSQNQRHPPRRSRRSYSPYHTLRVFEPTTVTPPAASDFIEYASLPFLDTFGSIAKRTAPFGASFPVIALWYFANSASCGANVVSCSLRSISSNASA